VGILFRAGQPAGSSVRRIHRRSVMYEKRVIRYLTPLLARAEPVFPKGACNWTSDQITFRLPHGADRSGRIATTIALGAPFQILCILVRLTIRRFWPVRCLTRAICAENPINTRRVPVISPNGKVAARNM
jgi:hypothetical protein